MNLDKETKKNDHAYLRKQACKYIKKYRINEETLEEKIKIAEDVSKVLGLTGDDKKIFITSILIPDDEEFSNIYNLCGKVLSECAKKINIPQEYVVAKVYEISKYGIYKEEEKTEMEDYEIIDSETPLNVSDSIDKKTADAMARINMLFEQNNSNTQVIGRQSNTIRDLNEKISVLEEEKKEDMDTIASLEAKVKVLETKLDHSNKEIHNLLIYKEAYEKLMNLLNEKSEKREGKTI